ncbi:MAG: ParB/RepB/Spo0J family partition protein [Candidatus Marinimicrobia bacterium]|nr:ParB/RepB/Spo0J family partition protein [Candidatus Neomarinimicrobiota bacterium]
MEIAVKKINVNNDFDYHYWKYNTDKLRNSIKQSGIKNPLTLIEKQNEFILIHGFRRLAIAKELNIAEIPVKIYSNEKLSEKIFIESVLENIVNVDLNIYEKCKIVQILKHNFPDFNKIYWQTLLEMPLDEKSEKTIDSILQFPKEWIEFFIEKNVPLKRIKTFTKIDEIESLSKMIQLNIGLNKLEQIFQLLFEISKRDEITVKYILENINYQKIINNSAITKQEIVSIIFDKLYNLRYPKQSKLVNKIDEKIDTLTPLQNIKIQYDKTFERSGINFIINLKDTDNLTNSIEWLKNNSSKISEIIK